MRVPKAGPTERVQDQRRRAMRGLVVVLIATLISLFVSSWVSCPARALSEQKVKKFLRLECRNVLPRKVAAKDEAGKRVSLLNFLEARFRGMIPPYSEERCREWGYEPVELPDVPDGWMRSPFLELLGELNMTPWYKRVLQAECRSKEHMIRVIEEFDVGKSLASITQGRRDGEIARYSLKRCLEWGIVPPSTDRRAH